MVKRYGLQILQGSGVTVLGRGWQN